MNTSVFNIPRFIPSAYELIAKFDEFKIEVWGTTSGKIAAITYGGKRSKHDWHYSFQSVDAMQRRIADLVEGYKQAAVRKAAVRKHLGRGSNQTIQKILHRMKSDLIESARIKQVDELPPMPVDEMQAVWRAAATSALRNSFERLVNLQCERDEAILKLADATDALECANLQIDELREAADLAFSESSASAANALKVIDELKACEKLAEEKSVQVIAELHGEISRLHGELSQLKFTMEQACSNFQIERGTLERVNERNFAQLVELRGWFDRFSGGGELPKPSGCAAPAA